MSLNDLSIDSLMRIFEFLNHDEFAKIMRCSRRYEQVLRENVRFTGKEAHEIRLIISRSRETKRLKSVTVAIVWMYQWSLRLAKSGKGCLQLLQYPDFEETAKEDYYIVRKRLLPSETCKDAESKLHSMVKDILPKISEFSVLTISGFKMNSALFEEMKNACCRPLVALVITDYDIAYTEEELSIILKTLNPSNFFFYGRASNLKLTDLHLAQIRQRFAISDEHSYNHNFLNIGDQSLLNWRYNTPQQVYLDCYRTSITLGGVIRFVQELMKKYSCVNKEAERSMYFYFGQINGDEQMKRNLTRLHQTRGLVFEWFKTWIEITHKHMLFRFKVYCPVRKITHQQAKAKILEISQAVAEKRNEDPEFLLWQDEDLDRQMNYLRYQLYDEWDEIYNVIENLESGI